MAGIVEVKRRENGTSSVQQRKLLSSAYAGEAKEGSWISASVERRASAGNPEERTRGDAGENVMGREGEQLE